jgi:2-isopropylmalate synthase
MGQVLIFDTTLRDGIKSPGASLTVEEKVRIAKQLVRLRVDVVEIGFPAASEEQFEGALRIAKEINGPVLAVLARATNPKDFEIAWEALRNVARPRLHTFIPVSRQYREHFLNIGPQKALDLASSAIKLARQYTADVEFTLVDAFRADGDEVVGMVRTAVEAGATTVNLADTVGCAVPSDISQLFARLLREVDGSRGVTFSIHCHNDLGLAVANSLAAVAEGVAQVHCTVNGIGERAGNTPLEELVTALMVRSQQLGATTTVQSDQVYPTSRLVRRLTGIPVQPHKPVVGANAFQCESAVPQLADATEKPPYEIVSPADLGIRAEWDVLTVQTTFEKFKERVGEMGYELSEEKAAECYRDFQELAAKKEFIFEADLELLVGVRAASDQIRFKLQYLNVTAGSISVPNATVRLEVDGQVLQDAGFGHGPVDAAFKTIFKMAKRAPKLVRYEVNAVTAGSDAQGEVSVSLEENDHLVNGRAVATDIVLASAQALVDGLNKLEAVREHPAISEFTDEESYMPRL